jgi:hypothetical protein
LTTKLLNIASLDHIIAVMESKMTDDVSDRVKLSSAIIERVATQPHLFVWTNDDFADLDTRNNVDRTLQRLAEAKTLSRPRRGYYFSPSPVISRLTGKPLFPSVQKFREAICRRDRLEVIVDPHTAANELGLETAIPSLPKVYADTTPRLVEFINPHGKGVSIRFMPMLSKKRFWAGRPGMRFVQALLWFDDSVKRGPEAAVEVIDNMSRTILSPESEETIRAVYEDLRDNVVKMPRWTETVMLRILDKVEAGLKSRFPHDQSDAQETEQDGPKP